MLCLDIELFWHPPGLIRVFAVRPMDSSGPRVSSDSDKTGRMPTLEETWGSELPTGRTAKIDQTGRMPRLI